MIPLWSIGLIGVLLGQFWQIHCLRRDLDSAQRHNDYRIDFAMRQIEDLHLYRERMNFQHWN